MTSRRVRAAGERQTVPEKGNRNRAGFPLAVVIPHFGDPELTRACVASIQKSDLRGTRIYVVDGTLAGDLPFRPHRVVCVDAGGAEGFAARCSLAAEVAFVDGAENVMFLNNDAVAAPETPGQLVSFSRETGAGVVAPVVLRLGAPGTVESAGIDFDRLTGRVTQSHCGRPYAGIRFEYRFVEAVAATCMLVTSEAARTSGLFDPALSFYFEDVDFCLRARSKGVRIAVLKEARVWHAGAASFRSARPADRPYLVTKHHLEVCRRHGRPLPRVLHMAREAHIIALNAAYFALREGPSPVSLGAVIRGAKGHFGGCSDSSWTENKV
ncbi:MAG: glycosyltransferase [Deltaproteobacteria bacterium]|nr:glycosyltransferase [Deltaproteobacteria bacterium]